MKTYGAYLANQQCEFDSATGFKTAKDALEWAIGRGGNYNIQIDDGNPLAIGPMLKAECSDGKTQLFADDIFAGTYPVSFEEAVKLVE